jgi:hypothetical protein
MIRIPENVLSFSNNVDLFKAWGDYFNHYRVVNYGKTLDYDNTVSLDEKAVKLTKAINAEVNKLTGYSADSIIPENVWKMSLDYRTKAYAIVNALVDMVLPDIVEDAYGKFTETRNLAYGDSAVFDIKSSDLFYVTKNGNGRRHVTAQKQFTGQTALIPTNHSITVQADIYRILCGKEDLAQFAVKVALSIEAEIAKDIYATLSGAYDSLTTNFREAAFTRDAFIKLRNRVAAANGGANVSVYGTNLALADVLPSNEYLKMELGQQYNQVGYLPVYMNTSLISLPQKIDWTSEDYDFAISDDELFFIASPSQSIVKLVLEGDTITVQDAMLANANMTQDITLHKRWATGIVTNSKFGIMHI